ncbi:hypothetical protein B7P34_34885 [Streptosporangium nondiastaticum]|uniref:Uncharacterized protein n=2 Tax=Actinomycetes TaxID=1760 RepID=A0A9X7JI97_9ACTN|nr:hypothetical protein B7P34_34885 [Streptosporangium nondiastaticum]
MPVPPRSAPAAATGARGGTLVGMQPVLDPNPKNGQKALLTILGAMLGITVVIAVIATVFSP